MPRSLGVGELPLHHVLSPEGEEDAGLIVGPAGSSFDHRSCGLVLSGESVLLELELLLQLERIDSEELGHGAGGGGRGHGWVQVVSETESKVGTKKGTAMIVRGMESNGANGRQACCGRSESRLNDDKRFSSLTSR